MHARTASVRLEVAKTRTGMKDTSVHRRADLGPETVEVSTLSCAESEAIARH